MRQYTTQNSQVLLMNMKNSLKEIEQVAISVNYSKPENDDTTDDHIIKNVNLFKTFKCLEAIVKNIEFIHQKLEGLPDV